MTIHWFTIKFKKLIYPNAETENYMKIVEDSNTLNNFKYEGRRWNQISH